MTHERIQDSIAAWAVNLRMTPAEVRETSMDELDLMVSLKNQSSGKPHTRRPRASEREWLAEQRRNLRGLKP